jgi:hypothetical protein
MHVFGGTCCMCCVRGMWLCVIHPPVAVIRPPKSHTHRNQAGEARRKAVETEATALAVMSSAPGLDALDTIGDPGLAAAAAAAPGVDRTLQDADELIKELGITMARLSVSADDEAPASAGGAGAGAGQEGAAGARGRRMVGQLRLEGVEEDARGEAAAAGAGGGSAEGDRKKPVQDIGSLLSMFGNLQSDWKSFKKDGGRRSGSAARVGGATGGHPSAVSNVSVASLASLASAAPSSNPSLPMVSACSLASPLQADPEGEEAPDKGEIAEIVRSLTFEEPAAAAAAACGAALAAGVTAAFDGIVLTGSPKRGRRRLSPQKSPPKRARRGGDGASEYLSAGRQSEGAEAQLPPAGREMSLDEFHDAVKIKEDGAVRDDDGEGAGRDWGDESGDDEDEETEEEEEDDDDEEDEEDEDAADADYVPTPAMPRTRRGRAAAAAAAAAAATAAGGGEAAAAAGKGKGKGRRARSGSSWRRGGGSADDGTLGGSEGGGGDGQALDTELSSSTGVSSVGPDGTGPGAGAEAGGQLPGGKGSRGDRQKMSRAESQKRRMLFQSWSQPVLVHVSVGEGSGLVVVENSRSCVSFPAAAEA